MARASSTRPRAQPTETKDAAKPKAIAFDSSFLIAVIDNPTPWREDILEGVGAFRPVLLASVHGELSRLASKGDKRGRSAGLALELVGRGGLALEPDGNGKPDDEIISFALREGAGVATIDSELAQRLRASRVRPVITLRGRRVST